MTKKNKHEDFPIPCEWKYIAELEKAQVFKIGDNIGYGRLMQLAEICWRERLKEQGFEGGEFRSGPCASLTVPCGCGSSCDWCEGCGWLTPHVKAIKDKLDKRD